MYMHFYKRWKMMIRSYGLSETGLVRKINEDAILVAEEKGFFLLADGMGGYEGGQVASTTAIEAAGEFLSEKAPAYSEAVLREAVLAANRAVLRKKIESEALRNMGTTMVAAAVTGHTLSWAHVGDSRLYLFRKGTLTQVTRDHSFVMTLVDEGKITPEEMREHPRKNEITRAVGIGSVLEVDAGEISLDAPSLILICSDGLSTLIDDETIRSVLSEKENDLAACAETLFAKVYDAGATDNISAILVEYTAQEI